MACSANDGESGAGKNGGGKSSAAGGSNAFPQRNVLVTANCWWPNGRRGVVGVDGWNPQNRQHMAHVQFRLPKTAIGGESGPGAGETRPNSALKELCRTIETPTGEQQSAIRSLFDRDITKMAVVTEDPKTHASHVGYVDRSGRFTDLTGNPQSGSSPHEDNATLAPDGSAVWFTRELGGHEAVASRPTAGNHNAADRLRIDSADDRHLIMAGTQTRAVLAKSAHLTPDGKRVLAKTNVLDFPAGRQVVDSKLIADKGRPVLCGARGILAGWLGNDTVLCNDVGMNIFFPRRITPKAAPGKTITPESDVRKDAMVTSPDGQKFLFRSFEAKPNEERPAPDYFISTTKAGAKPEKLQRTGAFAKLSNLATFIDWR